MAPPSSSSHEGNAGAEEEEEVAAAWTAVHKVIDALVLSPVAAAGACAFDRGVVGGMNEGRANERWNEDACVRVCVCNILTTSTRTRTNHNHTPFHIHTDTQQQQQPQQQTPHATAAAPIPAAALARLAQAGLGGLVLEYVVEGFDAEWAAAVGPRFWGHFVDGNGDGDGEVCGCYFLLGWGGSVVHTRMRPSTGLHTTL